MSDTLKNIVAMVMVLLALLGSTLFGASKYNKLNDKLDIHLSERAMDDKRAEHRLTVIEQQIKRTNEILAEIRDELRRQQHR